MRAANLAAPRANATKPRRENGGAQGRPGPPPVYFRRTLLKFIVISPPTAIKKATIRSN